MRIYDFIKTHSNCFTVKKMCRTFSVCESGYFRWLTSPRKRTEERLQQRIQELYTEHNCKVGSPSTADLRSEVEFSHVGKNRVARLMKEAGLRCKATKKFRTTTDSNHNEPVAANLLDRNFNPASPNQAWVSDSTYIRVGRDWRYLTVFIDYFLHDVGWDVSDSLHRDSMIRAFERACLRRNPSRGLLVHSDRDVQYASSEFRLLLKKKGAIQSMSRKGNCWDNAVAESFFHTLKTQYIYHQKFKDEDALKFGLFKYIELYYNRRRRHSGNNWRTPSEVEECFFYQQNLFNSDWMKTG